MRKMAQNAVRPVISPSGDSSMLVAGDGRLLSVNGAGPFLPGKSHAIPNWPLHIHYEELRLFCCALNRTGRPPETGESIGPSSLRKSLVSSQQANRWGLCRSPWIV